MSLGEKPIVKPIKKRAAAEQEGLTVSLGVAKPDWMLAQSVKLHQITWDQSVQG